MSQIAFEGNLTKDPELRFTPAGKGVCNFSVAVNKRVKEGDKWVDGDASFYDVSAWQQLAEDCAGLERGQKVIVIGELSQRFWEKDGQKRSSWEVRADSVGRSILFESRENG